MKKTASGHWPFYISGPLLAVLIVLSLYLFNDTVGLGETFTMVSEYCVDSVESRSLEAPPMDWQLGLLIGIFLGAAGAAAAGKEWKLRFRDGENWVKTIACGILGGYLVMSGIQLAGDSFLGQFAAAMQLAGAAWLFWIVTAAAGIVLSCLLAQRAGGRSAGGNSAPSGGKTPRKSAKKQKA